MKYKVLLTTSGLGSRLGELTKFTNKALIRVKDKPVVSYIIESYPKKVEFVVTLGYFGDHVKQFLEMAYPDRKFTFVKVDKYEGEGSSLLYSMRQAEKYLQCPFIFHASDTLVYEKIPAPTVNWDGGFKGTNGAQYRSFDAVDGEIVKFYDKGMIRPDYLHIGLVGIHDYKTFWKEAKKGGDSDVSVVERMKFKVVEFKEWNDTGNVQSLYETWAKFGDLNRAMDKTSEGTFFIDGYVIKFFADEKKNGKRVARGKLLKGFVPEIVSSSSNFFKYKYVKGELLADICTPKEFRKFMLWLDANFWKYDEKKDISGQCKKFYYDKTVERVNKFLTSHNLVDKVDIINGEKVPTIMSMLKDIKFTGKASRFHGDLILDNVLKTSRGYVLLDWRQDFAGDLEIGDLTYDLAKLNHNMTINHDVVNKGLYTIKIKKSGVFVDILRPNRLVECQETMGNNYIRILTALIWLNMAPLHQHPFDLFLYYFGKYNLWKALKT